VTQPLLPTPKSDPSAKDDLAAITLAILAGGEGSRMGRPKAQLKIADIPILQWMMLQRLCWPGPRLLVTSPGREHRPACEQFDREIADSIAGEGPLRGIITAYASPLYKTSHFTILP
jgi:molybdopterin-guanine dinucleotide biosynthesis protein A